MGVTAVLIAIAGVFYYRNHCRFSEGDWKGDKGRSRMVSSLINTGILERKSYDEVIAILGEPSFYQRSETQVKDTDDLRLVYLTGGGRLIDLERFIVIIENDTVARVYVTYD